MSGGPYCYTYDGNGVRVAKSNANGGSCTGSPTVDVLYWRTPSGDAIAETEGTGSTSNSNYHEYVFFAGRRIARSDPSSSNVYFYFADQLGTTRSVTQADGTVCFSADYYPYGEEVDYTTSCPQNYKFTGYERDAETGLDYAFKRHYNSRMARFMSADSWGGVVGSPQSHNACSYVVNNPVALVDRFGACPGGFAENRDNNRDRSQDSVSGGGPFLPDGDFEVADPAQMSWSRTPGPCPGFTDQGGGGANDGGLGGVSIGINNFTTLDYMDMGQIPSGLMGVPTDPGVYSGSNDTYFGFGLGFSPFMESGPFGLYYEPGAQCTTASGGMSCGNDASLFNSPYDPTIRGGQTLPTFRQVSDQIPSWWTLLPDTSSPGTFPPPKLVLPKAPANPPPGPGKGPVGPPPCGSVNMAITGILNLYQLPIAAPFSALSTAGLFQAVPGMTCSP